MFLHVPDVTLAIFGLVFTVECSLRTNLEFPGLRQRLPVWRSDPALASTGLFAFCVFPFLGARGVTHGVSRVSNFLPHVCLSN